MLRFSDAIIDGKDVYVPNELVDIQNQIANFSINRFRDLPKSEQIKYTKMTYKEWKNNATDIDKLSRDRKQRVALANNSSVKQFINEIIDTISKR
jgi:hypothetical protein